MKNTLFMLIIFGLLIGFTGNAPAWDGDAGKSQDGKASPAREEKGSVKTSAGSNSFDETTTQYFKKFRSINSELVAAHQELYKYNNPDKSTKGLSLDEFLNQEGTVREMKTQGQITQNKKARTEEKISGLQKDAEDLKNDLIKYYKGKLPKNVSDAWKTEQDYTEYRIAKYK
ncbi:MAG: hypothetical protein H6Q52_823 [Deltaproteobacteria bacterium]|nr:hypothetical protein [Deltaproteobacteria bacterium]